MMHSHTQCAITSNHFRSFCLECTQWVELWAHVFYALKWTKQMNKMKCCAAVQWAWNHNTFSWAVPIHCNVCVTPLNFAQITLFYHTFYLVWMLWFDGWEVFCSSKIQKTVQCQVFLCCSKNFHSARKEIPKQFTKFQQFVFYWFVFFDWTN